MMKNMITWCVQLFLPEFSFYIYIYGFVLLECCQIPCFSTHLLCVLCLASFKYCLAMSDDNY